MSKTSGLVAALLVALLLAGCPGRTQPSPTPQPTSPPATALPVTPLLATSTPDGWIEHQTNTLITWLPADWEVIDFAAGDVQAIFADLQERNPTLARIIGSPEALHEAEFWAFRGANTGASFADNLNIRRTPLAGQRVADMQALLDPVVAQYQQLGFQIIASDARLSIGGQPAAYVAFSFDINTGGAAPTSLQGHQYLIAAPTDLWILSYSAGPDTGPAQAPIFRQSALSFRVK